MVDNWKDQDYDLFPETKDVLVLTKEIMNMKSYTVYYPISDYVNFLKANKKENFCHLFTHNRKQSIRSANFLIEKGFICVDVWEDLGNGKERLIYQSVERKRN